MNKQQLTDTIKQQALTLGFDAVGIAPSQLLEQDKEYLIKWLNKGYAASMKYMHTHLEKRVNPASLLENTRSVIVVLYHYLPTTQQACQQYKIAKYAYTPDYHYVIKSKLQQLASLLPTENADIQRWFTDSAPVLERRWAQLAGLGWIGKNGCFIHPQLGSYVFIGEIFTEHELVYDTPYTHDHCGTCTRCLQACPTQALIAPRELDANKCISYHTIESKNEIPSSIAQQLKGYIFGCDICQDICPWNAKIVAKEKKDSPTMPYVYYSDQDWLTLDKKKFKQDFRHSPMQRAGYVKLIKNIRTVVEK